MPTLVFFLAKMRLVTARFLWRNSQYAILIIFILAAVLTSTPDWWNQTVFAAPMIALYLISIVIAWVVGPKRAAGKGGTERNKPGLVIGAMAIDQARGSIDLGTRVRGAGGSPLFTRGRGRPPVC